MGQVDRAVILAAGKGTRLQKEDPDVRLDESTLAMARLGIKALVPIAGRPYLDYGIDRLAAAGIRRVCLVVAPGSDLLKQYVDRLPDRYPGLETETVVQPEARGTAHAVRFAREWTAGREFLLMNSDNLYPQSALHELAAAPPADGYAVGFEEQALIAHSNFTVDRVSRLGILVPSESDSGCIEGVVEKPEDPSRYRVGGKLWITMNIWRFSSKIFHYCEIIPLSSRGEYELTSAVQALVEDGHPVRMIQSCEGVLDLTSRADIPHLAEILAA